MQGVGTLQALVDQRPVQRYGSNPQTGVLFNSDLGTHTGQREAVTEADRSQEIVDFVRQSGYMAPGAHVTTALSHLRALPMTCLAAMHGSAI